ncbi:GNAT family N-acetyltransferase [Streptococcus sp. X16XC17]|uniref:GNAT family N-acetyltransferase n=1 Tax=unclassified Streptococcus TaxID=2608887 RepID=UPI00066FC909|nr:MULTISPECIES: GNAT family N-acetyltransferase [unclassified Streptococcus]TCD46353.1 GNAT family N-acetyltransferase [Streptococcus sp. X16XC17]
MIRPLQLTDAEFLQEINEIALGYAFPLEATKSQLVRLLADDHHFLKAFVDVDRKRLVAYVHAERYESLYSEARFNVLALAVHPDFQGRQIGQKLMQALEDEARARHLSFVRLNSGSNREEAHAFYKKIGYIDDKLQVRFLKELWYPILKKDSLIA